ncbi:MAG: carbohydrate-binding protein [Candidatus Eisenbacteria bacterium]|nr:carbohydrate-binding protein [Candidatus Eisenbacteria bacterium]
MPKATQILAFSAILVLAAVPAYLFSAPIHTTYLWHMHQPIYWPDKSTWNPWRYETAFETVTLGHSQSDVFSIFNWVVVPDIHIARACKDYPFAGQEDNCDPPNQADKINPPQGTYTKTSISRGVAVKVPPGYAERPHYAKYIDPGTGTEYKILVIPSAMAPSWNEGYGMYGTSEIDSMARFNDPAHPILVLFSHDGDNAWSGGYSYYYENVSSFSHQAVSRGYEPTTVEEYLQDHPVDLNDIVHVEAEDSQGNVKRTPIQHVWIGTGAGGDEACFWEPETPSLGDTLSIFYSAVYGTLPDTASRVFIRIGHSGWKDILTPDPAMVFDAERDYWKYRYAIPSQATSVDFVFNDGRGNWDNNSGDDWTVPVSGTIQFVMDGVLDSSAVKIASSSGIDLRACVSGTVLYFATQGVLSTNGVDHFVFVSTSPGSLKSAPWAKSGSVASWNYFLGGEDSNNWCGWFDGAGTLVNSSSLGKAQGAALEGTIDLEALFRTMPRRSST